MKRRKKEEAKKKGRNISEEEEEFVKREREREVSMLSVVYLYLPSFTLICLPNDIHSLKKLR